MLRYSDSEKGGVVLDGGAYIPRGHRFWTERGIDNAEAAGRISPFAVEEASNKAVAKAARDAAISSPIYVMGVVWDVDLSARDNINEAINSASRQPEKELVSRGWILADNSIRQTTANDLREVMNAYAARMDDIYVQYGAWLAGGMGSDFIVSSGDS